MQLFNLIPPFLTVPAINGKPVNLKSCLVITSSSPSISRFNRFIEGIKMTWQLDEEYFNTIRISVSEALMNAIVHGNKSKENQLVYISAVRNGNVFTFTIEDEGNGFDPENISDPLLPENLLKPGGRGIFIMKHLADSVSFSKNGKCVKLVFGSN